VGVIQEGAGLLGEHPGWICFEWHFRWNDSGNLSLFKEFVINESRGSRVEFRRRELQYLNHTQFGAPGQNGGISANLGSSNFGAITSAWDPRVFQFGLKLIYWQF
jgi:hypothetical protein